MKKHILVAVLFFCLLGTDSFSQTTLDSKFGEMINNRQFFQLKRALEKATEADVSPFIWTISNAIVDSYFNGPEKAEERILLLLNNYQQELGTMSSIGMVGLLVKNYAQLGQYDKATEMLAGLIPQIESFYDPTELASMRKRLELYEALRNVSGLMVYNKNQPVILSKDELGLLTIPVKGSNGKKHDLVLGTGTAMSILSESTAADLGANILSESVAILEFPDVRAKVGVSSKWQLGSLVAENAVFYIVPDSALTITSTTKFVEGKPVQHPVEGIVGWNFIRALGKLQITRSGKLSFNIEKPVNTPQNLMVVDGVPYVELISGNETLLFSLNTGAVETSLTNDYYEKHKDQLKQPINDVVIEMRGMDSTAKNRVLVLPNFPLQLGGTPTVVPTVSVTVDLRSNPEPSKLEPMDGTIGQNAINLYNRMVIDMENMSVVLD